MDLGELEIPVSTDFLSILTQLQADQTDKMTVVFCTYHSLPNIADLQDQGVPEFDIIFCDEAHRTTGVKRENEDPSHFVLVHDNERIRAKKRLYMTATPKLYAPEAVTRARTTAQQNHYDIDVFSMDDEEKYGKQFHRLPFSKAVEIGELSDYKVVIFAISERDVNTSLRGDTSAFGNEIGINDASKIVGCWRTLQNPENKEQDDESIKPLKRVYRIHKQN